MSTVCIDCGNWPEYADGHHPSCASRAAVPPRPAAPDACSVCGYPEPEHVSDGEMVHDFRRAAPDVSTDTGALREAILGELTRWPVGYYGASVDMTDTLLALPALRDLIAERDQAVAAVGRVREVLADADDAEWGPHRIKFEVVSAPALRRALDGAT